MLVIKRQYYKYYPLERIKDKIINISMQLPSQIGRFLLNGVPTKS